MFKNVAFSGNFVPKVCKSAIAHRTPKKVPHTRTSRSLSRMDFARTRTRATTHRTCACAHAPSQLIPCKITTITQKKSLQIQSKIISVQMVQFDEFKLRDLIPFLSKKFPSLMKQMRQKKKDCTNK